MEHRGRAEVLENVTLTTALRVALRSLDEVDEQHIFRDRASTLAGVAVHSIPRRPCVRECQSPGHGFGGAEPVGQPQDRSRGRRIVLPWCPTRRGHDIGLATAPGWDPLPLPSSPRCANVDGAALDTARRRRETTYPELHGRNGRTRLVVLGAEVGGRWSDQSAKFVRQVAKAEARGELPIFRRRGHTGGRAMSSLSHCRWLEHRGGLGADGATPSTSQESESKCKVKAKASFKMANHCVLNICKAD